MRTLTSGTLTVQAYDEAVWKQERNVLRVTDTNATVAALYSPNLSTKLAEYTLDENKSVEIDLTDFIRAHAQPTDVFVRTNGGAAQWVKANYRVAGLINPANVMIPRTISGQPIEPPSVMYAQIFDGSANSIHVELFAKEYAVFVTMRGSHEGFNQVMPGQPIVIWGYNFTHARFSTESKTTHFAVKQPEACKQYAAVRWVSFTGQTRLHVWEVVQSKTETDGAFELLTQDGAFNVVKGRKDGFALRLDGLNAYDVWYYSDVCHSSSVEVSLDGQTWQRVNVTSKGVTVQDGNAGKTNTLLVELTYKKYDAVSM